MSKEVVGIVHFGEETPNLTDLLMESAKHIDPEDFEPFTVEIPPVPADGIEEELRIRACEHDHLKGKVQRLEGCIARIALNLGLIKSTPGATMPLVGEALGLLVEERALEMRLAKDEWQDSALNWDSDAADLEAELDITKQALGNVQQLLEQSQHELIRALAARDALGDVVVSSLALSGTNPAFVGAALAAKEVA